jgi:hypothetical protein
MRIRIVFIIVVCAGLFAIMAIQSCTEKIDIHLKSSSVRCIIYGEITTDTNSHYVRITKSADYYNSKPAKPVTGAKVNISDGIKTYPLTESLTLQGYYFTDTDVYGIPGRTYTLNVSNVDLLGDGNLESFSAVTELKPVIKIDSIDTEYNTRWDVWEVKAWATDPKETDDFYLFYIHINEKLYAASLANLVVTNDQFFNGNSTNGATVYYLDKIETIQKGDYVTLDICCITRDYYNFITEAQTISRGQNPLFSGPPANVSTNLTNGAMGYFTAYSVSRASKIVK